MKTNIPRPTITARLTTTRTPFRAFMFLNCSMKLNGLFSSSGGNPKNNAPNAYNINKTEMATNNDILGDMYGLNECFKIGCVLFKA